MRKSVLLKKKLLEEINSSLYPLNEEEVIEALQRRGIISDTGFIIDSTIGEYPFEDAAIIFFCFLAPDCLKMGFTVVNKENGTYIIKYGLDNEIYNFLKIYYSLILDRDIFDLFEEDREKFIDYLFKYRDFYTMRKKIANKTKFLDRNSLASNPGKISLSKEKWEEVAKFITPTFKKKLYMRNKFHKVKEILVNGDTQPAVVVSTDPLIISCYSDEMDTVVFLKFPDFFTQKYNLTIGKKLVTVCVYKQFGERWEPEIEVGPKFLGRYSNVYVYVPLFLAIEEEKCENKIRLFDLETWKMVYELSIKNFKENPNQIISGLHYLYDI